MPQPKGKIIGFDQIRAGKALLKLNDKNYLEVHLNVLKVTKGDQPNLDGTPQYFVQTVVTMALWKKEEIEQLKKMIISEAKEFLKDKEFEYFLETIWVKDEEGKKHKINLYTR